MDSKTFLIGVIAIIFFFISFRGCKDNDNYSQQSSQQQTSYSKSPVDVLIRDLSAEQNFTIILYDMDYNESANQYQHKYNVLVERPDSVYAQETDWLLVSSTFFNANVDNMGMEIASKKDGKVSKIPAPAGYTNYIGNEKYGQWKESNGTSFWEFYGKYAFISSMFHMAMFPVRYGYWNDYNSNYYGRRAYYGPANSGRKMYGTNSQYAKSNNSSKWNNKSSSFKSRVRSKVSQSTASKSRVDRTSTTKRTRTSSRYSGSSSRSRSGGFGK